MAQLVVTYYTPDDPKEFDRHYFETHVPLAKAIPGLRRFELTEGPVLTPAGASDIYRIAILHFDSVEAIRTSFASPQGQATSQDAQKFMTDRDTLLMFEKREI